MSKNCVSAHGRHFFLFKVILLSDQSCDRENVEYKSQKIIAIFIFVKDLLTEKKDAPENDNEDEDSGAMPASSPSSSDIIPPTPTTQWPSKSSSEPQQPNQVSSRGRGTQRKTSLISSRGHRGRQRVSISDISSRGDSQINKQDTPEPSPSTFGASRTCTGPQRQIQMVWKWIDMWKQLHTYRHTFSGAARFEMWFARWCQAYWLFQFVLYRCCNTKKSLMKQTGMPISFWKQKVQI